MDAETSAAQARRSIDRLRPEAVQAVLNLLLEATFFYPEDDPEHFLYLRRHEDAFAAFIRAYFGQRLHVDSALARLVKERTYNGALGACARALFDFRSRAHCLAFVLVLEAYEAQAVVEGRGRDAGAVPRFLLSDLCAFVKRRHHEVLAGRAPDDRAIVRALLEVLQELEKHRFIRAVERGPAGAEDTGGVAAGEKGSAGGAGHEEEVVFEWRGGMRCYRADRLDAEAAFAQYAGVEERDLSGRAAAGASTAGEDA